MAQKEMTRITKERISEIIARIEMYGHGAGYTADEVLALAQMALAACKDDKKMKLIGLLVKELPKCGGWPDGMSYCYLPSVNLMAPCATFAFGSDHKKDTFFGRNFCCEIELPIGDLDSDEYQSVVTREQYESALIASQKVEFNGDELESKTHRLDFGQWLEQQRGKIDVDCGCVSAETFMHWLRVAYEAGNYPDIPDSSVPAPGKGVTGERIRIKPHVYRELVNRLHDTAAKCAGTQQLRERISRVLGDVITPDHHKQAEKSGLERCHLEAALNIKPGHTLGIIDALLVHKMARALLPLVADKHEAGHANES
ncbi:TPA: hypothetical protein JLO81_004312 [Escherichia coli]|uniref:hypothetical protein n=1 Tax=Escherichia coli TaxID=562 RepID=UPI001365E19D|nr:hypothetical protein [Escherichia coli]NBZ59347.1 hypothetical protein [Escherichia coli]HBB9696366.1 hypothetical protein [Escherichia coli]